MSSDPFVFNFGRPALVGTRRVMNRSHSGQWSDGFFQLLSIDRVSPNRQKDLGIGGFAFLQFLGRSIRDNLPVMNHDEPVTGFHHFRQIVGGRMIVRSFPRERIRERISTIWLGSSPLVGSSRIRMGRVVDQRLSQSNRWRWPLERVPISCPMKDLSPQVVATCRFGFHALLRESPALRPRTPGIHRQSYRCKGVDSGKYPILALTAVDSV